jgi:hypothetical protein
MLINYLFYSLEKGLIGLENDNGTHQPAEWLGCRLSLLKGFDLEIGMANNYLFVKTPDGSSLKSIKELGLNYVVKETDNGSLIFYKVFSLNCELRFVIQVNKSLESKFRQIFKEHFIFTAVNSNFQHMEFFDEGLVVKNYMLKLNDRGIYTKDPVYAKIFEKETITNEKLENFLYESLRRSFRLPKSIKLNMIQMFETDKQFIVVFEKSKDLISLEFFINNQNLNSANEHELINQIIVLNLIEMITQLEKLNICFPVLNPQKILISKVVIKNSLLLQNADFFSRHSILNKEANTSEDRTKEKEKYFGNILKYFINFKDFKIGKIHDINYEMYQKNKNLINLKIVNTEFLFDFDQTFRRNDRIIKSDLGTLSLVSNLFLNLSRNLNTINIGFVFLYMLTKMNFGIENKHIKNEYKTHFCVNFPLNLLKNASPKNKLIIQMLFEDSSLESIVKKITDQMIENSKIDNMANQEDQTFVFTSDENANESPVSKKEHIIKSFDEVNDLPQTKFVDFKETTLIKENTNSTVLQDVTTEHIPFENQDLRVFSSINPKLMTSLKKSTGIRFAP